MTFWKGIEITHYLTYTWFYHSKSYNWHELALLLKSKGLQQLQDQSQATLMKLAKASKEPTVPSTTTSTMSPNFSSPSVYFINLEIRVGLLFGLFWVRTSLCNPGCLGTCFCRPSWPWTLKSDCLFLLTVPPHLAWVDVLFLFFFFTILLSHRKFLHT